MKKIIIVAGARPNFMKVAPIIEEIKKYPELKTIFIHTGQHYDENMSENFFKDLKLPSPDINLGAKGGTSAEQVSDIIPKFEKVLLEEKPDLVIVVGDVNSTAACAYCAKQNGIKVAHVEAGLRSGDLSMPEEINRIVTDSISDYFFVTEESGIQNLKKEGKKDNEIFHVGNVMIDTLVKHLPQIQNSLCLEKYVLEKEGYGVITIHRPSNVDKKDSLLNILRIIKETSQKIKLVFPMHPRTRKRIENYGLENEFNSIKNLIITEPLSYIKFMSLLFYSAFAMTDSGGIQEETSYLGIPCLTIRNNTERPVTIAHGTNQLVGEDPEAIASKIDEVLTGPNRKNVLIPLWDGKAAERIVLIIRDEVRG